MALSHDELAGVVDLFGALALTELSRACAELAFKRGEEAVDATDAVAEAVAAYRLVAFERAGDRDETGTGAGGGTDDHDAGEGWEGAYAPVAPDELGDGTLLAAGPAAFPTLPAGAADLPHILAVEPRDPDPAALGEVVEERLRAEAARALAAGEAERVAQLLDASYEVEAWAPVDLGDVRERLDAVVGDANGTSSGSRSG
ncbi:hypothetical protein BRC90_02335 [Halobacteriales archaeon QS_4_69_34]|nr:MAG: hypothetical protein BRC90_02335 [Halobacteriales archaeon QS_4_69_34]